MNQEGRITTERQGYVLLIGLDRSAKRNAFDKAMLNALAIAYAELEHDNELRCGVLFAHGEHFTGGLELTQFASSLGHFEYPEGAIDPPGIQGPRLTKPVCWLLVASVGLNRPVRTPQPGSRSLPIPQERCTISNIHLLNFTKGNEHCAEDSHLRHVHDTLVSSLAPPPLRRLDQTEHHLSPGFGR